MTTTPTAGPQAPYSPGPQIPFSATTPGGSTPSNPTGTTPSSGQTMDSFFAALRRSPFTRSSNRMVAGVCAGLAERMGASPAIVRVAAFVLGWFTPILPLYLLAVLMIPNHKGEIRLERAAKGGDAGSIVLLVVTALMIFPGSFVDGGMGWLWLVAVSVGAGIYLANRNRRTPAALAQTPPAPYQQTPPPYQPYPTATPSFPPQQPTSGPQDASH